MKSETKDRILGCLYGQAIGDALGLGSEFMTLDKVNMFYPEGLSQYNQIIQDAHRRRFAKGAWTDDTEMMLCIMDGVESNGKICERTVAGNFKQWCEGDPMGIGRHTFNVLCIRDYEDNPKMCAEIMWKLGKCRSAANGGLMRTSVVGCLQTNVEHYAEEMCLLTHTDKRCVGSCVVVSWLINRLVYGKDEPTMEDLVEIASRYDERIGDFIVQARNTIDINDLKLTGEDMGYTLKTLSAGLWAYFHCNSFQDGLVAVVNAGGDADTNAAVACAILGAKFGFQSIPKYYVDNLNRREYYQTKCETFLAKINLYGISSNFVS